MSEKLSIKKAIEASTGIVSVYYPENLRDQITKEYLNDILPEHHLLLEYEPYDKNQDNENLGFYIHAYQEILEVAKHIRIFSRCPIVGIDTLVVNVSAIGDDHFKYTDALNKALSKTEASYIYSQDHAMNQRHSAYHISTALKQVLYESTEALNKNGKKVIVLSEMYIDNLEPLPMIFDTTQYNQIPLRTIAASSGGSSLMLVSSTSVVCGFHKKDNLDEYMCRIVKHRMYNLDDIEVDIRKINNNKEE